MPTWPRTRRSLAYPRRTVRLIEIRLLEGPNVYRLVPVVKVEVSVGRTRTWQGSRTTTDGIANLGRTVAATRLAGPHRRHRRLDPAPARRPRRARRAVHGPSGVGHGTLGRHLALVRCGTSAADRRGRVRPLDPQRVAGPTGAPDRHPGRPARSLDGPDRRGSRDAALVDPRRGPEDAGHLGHRHQRQVDGEPPDDPHPAAGRAPRRHDDLRRDPGRRADDRPRRLDGSRRRGRDPAPERRGRGGARDRPRGPGAARHGLRVERGQRVHQRVLGPPRPPGHPHPRRAGRGQVDDLPGDEARRLGRAERRRPPGRRRRATGQGAPGAGSRSTPTARG